MNQKLLWGIDLGGTKIEGIVASADALTKPHARIRIDTEASHGYDHVISRIEHLIGLLSAKSGAQPSAIGIGTPGTIDPALDAIKNSNSQCLNGRPLHKDLAQILKVPVTLMNDANCFALAEQRFGAAKNLGNVFGVILGTGVGGGVIINGKPIFGLHGIGGEWGHNVLEEGGAKCYCGKAGCVEQVISGPALEQYYKFRSGTALSLREISERHEDVIAVETMKRLVSKLGQALSTIINVLDPDAIVLGGGVSNLDCIYANIHQAIRPWIFNHEVRTPILKAQLGDSAGVFGAALLTS